MAKETRTPSGDAGIASKMAQAKERMSAEVKVLGDMIQREIVEAREWPPPPEIAADIKKRSFALGARSVKLLEAVDKLEGLRARLEDENTKLSDQVHELRMKSSGISPAELAHLQMENKVLKEHVAQLEEAIAGGSDTGALEADNARLLAQLKELEGEVDRLLKESADAHEAKEENQSLRKTAEALKAEVDALKAGGARKTAPGASFLASVWDSTASEDGADKDPRVASLAARISDLEADNQEIMEKGRKKLESVSRERDQLAVKVAELAESAALRAEQAIQEIHDLREERARLEKDLETARTEGQGAMACPDAGSMVKSLKTEVETLRQELENARGGENEVISELRAEIAKLKETGQAPAPEPAAMSGAPAQENAGAEIAALRFEAESLRKRVEELDAQKRDLSAKASQAESAAAASQKQGSADAELKERISLLQRELTGARNAVVTAAEESDHLREEVKNLFQEWVRVEASARELRVERDDLDAKLQTLNAELDSARAAMPQAQSPDGSVPAGDLHKVVSSLEKYIGELEAELDKRDAELEALKSSQDGNSP